MNKKIAIVGQFLPGELAQIVEALATALDEPRISAYETLQSFVADAHDHEFNAVITEHSFSLCVQDKPNDSDEYRQLVERVPTLHTESPLYSDEASLHLFEYLNRNRNPDLAVIYTRNIRSAQEDVESRSFRFTIRTIEKNTYSMDELIRTIREHVMQCT